jgi:hypothetical protein
MKAMQTKSNQLDFYSGSLLDISSLRSSSMFGTELEETVVSGLQQAVQNNAKKHSLWVETHHIDRSER